MERSNREQLAAGILALSVADTWAEAVREWYLEAVYRQDEPDTCLCGHSPIMELCVLRNRKNGEETIVGNVCVKKFMGIPSDLVFQAVRRVSKDISKALNAEAIQHARSKGWINNWERSFLLDTMHKRKLSDKQMDKREQINALVISKVNRNRQATVEKA